MKREEISKEFMHQLTRKLVDRGLLIEAGWVCYKLMCVKDESATVEQMHCAFLAGAAHLFISITGMLDDDREPTADDLRRMQLIHDELSEFIGLLIPLENTSH